MTTAKTEPVTVVADTAEQRIVAAAPIEHVISGSAFKTVGYRRATDGVMAMCSDDVFY